jgi:hypothetical protein
LEHLLILLRQLIKNQFPFFKGQEKRCFRILFECRSEYNPSVAGAANYALIEFISKLDSEYAVGLILNILQEWGLNDTRGYAYFCRKSKSPQAFPTPEGFQVLMGVSAIQFIGIASKNIQKADLSSRVLLKCLPILSIALNSSKTTVRKAAIECLVDFSVNLGELIWPSIGSHLNSVQKKLLGVYILRANQKNHLT